MPELVPVDHNPFLFPVDHDPFAGDPEAAGAAMASRMMAPATQPFVNLARDVGKTLLVDPVIQAYETTDNVLSGRGFTAEEALNAAGLAMAGSAGVGGFGAGPRLTLYRSGGPKARYGGPTFYSTAAEGAAPYAVHGDAVLPYEVRINNLFDASQGEHARVYRRFLEETGSPAGYGKNGYPFWTSERDLAAWLREQGVSFDAIKFDENTGHPSVAHYSEPIRAYHASPADFSEFDSSKIGTTTDAGALGSAHYFSTDPRVAESGPHRYEVDLDVRSPLNLEKTEWGVPGQGFAEKRKMVTAALQLPGEASGEEIASALTQRGHDSVSLDYSPLGYKHKEWAVLDPKLIDIVRKYGVAGLISTGAIPAGQYLIPVDHDPFQ